MQYTFKKHPWSTVPEEREPRFPPPPPVAQHAPLQLILLNKIMANTALLNRLTTKPPAMMPACTLKSTLDPANVSLTNRLANELMAKAFLPL
jgi:hypothetical protein